MCSNILYYGLIERPSQSVNISGSGIKADSLTRRAMNIYVCLVDSHEILDLLLSIT
jgi:hypothetical protein